MTHYERLGVKADSSADDIRKAYLDLAKQLHPDKTGGDKEKENRLKEINSSYDILKDPAKRKEYDLSLRRPHIDLNNFGGGDQFNHFSDAFAATHGKMYRNMMDTGRVAETFANITFEESYTGLQRDVEYTRHNYCNDCSGTGGSETNVCPNCKGTGQLTRLQNFYQITTACPTCKGRGFLVKKHCPSCSGLGKVPEKMKIMIVIPRGVHDKTIMEIPGIGGIGKTGAAPLRVLVNVAKNPRFERIHNDVVENISIEIPQAVLGDEITVKAITGATLKVNVPPGFASGGQLRLHNMGMPDMNNNKIVGDHILKVGIRIPKADDLNECEKESYHTLMSCFKLDN